MTPSSIYTLSLHDALPIYPPTHPEHTQSVEFDLKRRKENRGSMSLSAALECEWLSDSCHSHSSAALRDILDRKSTRLNSSHSSSSYAVYCVKKKVDSNILDVCNQRDDTIQYIHSFPTRRSSDLSTYASRAHAEC